MEPRPVALEPGKDLGSGPGVEIGQVDHGTWSRRAARSRESVQPIEEHPPQLGQAPIIAAYRGAAEGTGLGLDKLEDPNAPPEEARQPVQIIGRAHQCIKALDSQDSPADTVRRLGIPSRDVVRTDQQTAGKLGFVTGNHLTQGLPCIGLLRPVSGAAAAGEHHDACPCQVTLHLIQPRAHVRVGRGVVLACLACVLQRPVAMQIDESHRRLSCRSRPAQ